MRASQNSPASTSHQRPPQLQPFQFQRRRVAAVALRSRNPTCNAKPGCGKGGWFDDHRKAPNSHRHEEGLHADPKGMHRHQHPYPCWACIAPPTQSSEPSQSSQRCCRLQRGWREFWLAPAWRITTQTPATATVQQAQLRRPMVSPLQIHSVWKCGLRKTAPHKGLASARITSPKKSSQRGCWNMAGVINPSKATQPPPFQQRGGAVTQPRHEHT